MPALVSILIPCYNAAPYIGAALRSAVDQSWPNKEIIVVDDGSTDGSRDIVERFAGEGVRMVRQPHAGQSAAANRGARESKGDYVKFFDADDVLAPDMIERQMTRLAGSRTDVASAEWGRFYRDDLSTFRPNVQSVWRDMDPLAWLVEAWSEARPMMQCALWLIPRPVLDASGPWDERLSVINDFEFFTRVLCSSSRVLFTPGAPLYYRSGIPGSLSGRNGRAAAQSAFDSLTRGTSRLLMHRHDAVARRACANMLQDYIYTFYPGYADLRYAAGARVRELGGSSLRPSGSPWFERARRVLGWKLARRLQLRAQTTMSAQRFLRRRILRPENESVHRGACKRQDQNGGNDHRAP